MKSRFIVLTVLIFVAALFTGCATTGDLEKLQCPGQGSLVKSGPGSMKADQAAKDAAAAKASADASKAECCQCNRSVQRSGS